MVDAQGKKLSKRTGAISVDQCREMDLQPRAVVQYLAGLSGALPPKRLFDSLEEMAAAFQPFALGRGNAVMNMEELRALSARFFRALPPAELALNLILPETDPWHALSPQTQEELVESLRENAVGLQELCALLPYFTDEKIAYTPEVWNELAASLPVLAALEELLSALDPDARLDKEQSSAIFKQTGHTAGVKGRALYHPVRLALTGSASGPELAVLIMLLPVGRIVSRLRAVLEFFSNHQG
jgi:nondiscriminating glutamyl-tRNA synthetase